MWSVIISSSSSSHQTHSALIPAGLLIQNTQSLSTLIKASGYYQDELLHFCPSLICLHFSLILACSRLNITISRASSCLGISLTPKQISAISTQVSHSKSMRSAWFLVFQPPVVHRFTSRDGHLLLTADPERLPHCKSNLAVDAVRWWRAGTWQIAFYSFTLCSNHEANLLDRQGGRMPTVAPTGFGGCPKWAAGVTTVMGRQSWALPYIEPVLAWGKIREL